MFTVTQFLFTDLAHLFRSSAFIPLPIISCLNVSVSPYWDFNLCSLSRNALPLKSSMSFCDLYRRLNIQLLPDLVESREKETYLELHHSTTEQLLESARRCSLCALVKDPFLRAGHYHVPRALMEEKLGLDASSPALLRASRKNDGKSSRDRARLNFVEVLVNRGKDYPKDGFQLYAPQDWASSVTVSV
jgi:hypothetical protein